VRRRWTDGVPHLARVWKAKNRQLELTTQHGNPKQLAALTQEKHQLEARIQNLESSSAPSTSS